MEAHPDRSCAFILFSLAQIGSNHADRGCNMTCGQVGYIAWLIRICTGISRSRAAGEWILWQKLQLVSTRAWPTSAVWNLSMDDPFWRYRTRRTPEGSLLLQIDQLTGAQTIVRYHIDASDEFYGALRSLRQALAWEYRCYPELYDIAHVLQKQEKNIFSSAFIAPRLSSVHEKFSWATI